MIIFELKFCDKTSPIISVDYLKTEPKVGDCEQSWHTFY